MKLCGFSHTDTFSEELLESENDRLVTSVASKVSSLKHVIELINLILNCAIDRFTQTISV